MATRAQELYVYTDPASNIPAHSLVAKVSGNFTGAQLPYDRFMQRYVTELQAGLSKNLMLKGGAVFGNVHTDQFGWEAAYLYARYRVYSKDGAHKHFRVAVFGEIAYSDNEYHFDEVNLQGDKPGLQLGITATQLVNRLAVSATVSHVQVLHGSRNSEIIYIPSRIYQVMNYSLSAGYLILPVQYTDYKQTNLNIYAELLAQQGLDRSAYYVDFAPALQLIFNSNTKLNLGYRFQLGSDMERMGRNSFLVSVERTFLNALKK